MKLLDKDGLTYYTNKVKEKLNTKENTSNKVTSISSSSTDTQYPSAKCVYDSQATQDTKITNLESQVFGDETIEGEGTSLTLNNTLKGVFNEIDLKGNTSQTGTPTPSSPIPVNVVSGDNTITISNQSGTDSNTYNIDLPVENMLDTQYFQQGSIDASTGQDSSSNTNARGSNYIPVLPNTTYTLSANKNIFQLRLSEYQSDKTHIKRNSSNQNVSSYTITTSANCYYIRWSLNYDNSTSTTQVIIDSIDLQLEQGSKANSYTPYGITPIELCKIGNYQDYFAKSDGTQLFDKDNANILNGLITNTGGINSNASTRTLYIPCKPNTAYTISKISSARFVVGTTSSTPTLGGTTLQFQDFSTATSGTITTNSSANYLLVYYDNFGNTSTEQQIRDSIMINEGSSALPWQPYGVGKWYLHKKIGKKVFVGTETFIYNSASVWNLRYEESTMMTNDTGSTTYNFFSNYYKAQPGSDNDYAIGQLNNGKLICFRNINITSANDFKTWLSTHNTDVYYILETPTNTEITYQPLIDQLNLLEKAQSKENQTNISQVNNDLPFIISASAFLNNINGKIALLDKLMEV